MAFSFLHICNRCILSVVKDDRIIDYRVGSWLLSGCVFMFVCVTMYECVIWWSCCGGCCHGFYTCTQAWCNFQREYVKATWSAKDNGSSSKVVLIEFPSLLDKDRICSSILLLSVVHLVVISCYYQLVIPTLTVLYEQWKQINKASN